MSSNSPSPPPGEGLSSPDRLDELIKITSAHGWVALTGIGLVVLTIGLWSIYGSIPTTVVGGGILIKTGGVVSVVAPVEGQVSHLYVEEGDPVRKGQIIARLEQPRLLDKVNLTRQALAEMEGRMEQLSAFGSENLVLQINSLERERTNLERSIEIDKEREGWLTEKIAIQEGLLAEGLITKQVLVDTKSNRDDVIQRIESNQVTLKQLEVREKELVNEREQQKLANAKSLNETRRKLELEEAELEHSSRVVSAYTGNVVEIRAFEGQVLDPGTPIMSLELTGQDIQELQALLYMSPDMGKQIHPGMLVQLSPRTVRREEYGYMLGIVTQVAEYPSSEQGVMRVLKNEALVRQFTEKGAPIAVFADLIPDAGTASGYKWSSSTGPPFKIFSGTLCRGTVEVREQAPLSLAIPTLKKQLGLD